MNPMLVPGKPPGVVLGVLAAVVLMVGALALH